MIDVRIKANNEAMCQHLLDLASVDLNDTDLSEGPYRAHVVAPDGSELIIEGAL